MKYHDSLFWHYINVYEVSWITLKNYYKVRWNYYKSRQLSLLQSAMDSYYKLRQLFYYKVRHGLLQIATGITKCDGFITNCDRYYKLRWLLQIATVHFSQGFLNGHVLLGLSSKVFTFDYLFTHRSDFFNSLTFFLLNGQKTVKIDAWALARTV